MNNLATCTVDFVCLRTGIISSSTNCRHPLNPVFYNVQTARHSERRASIFVLFDGSLPAATTNWDDQFHLIASLSIPKPELTHSLRCHTYAVAKTSLFKSPSPYSGVKMALPSLAQFIILRYDIKTCEFNSSMVDYCLIERVHLVYPII